MLLPTYLKPPAKIPFTQETYDKLQTELDRLLLYREEVVVRLTTAREMGDLSENGAYRYAKQELGDVSRQIRNLKYKIMFGYVAAKHTGSTIGFGNTITIESNGKSLTFMLVSKHESDPSQHKLSTESPIGQAVLGKKVGDIVTVTLPHSSVIYTITNVE